MARKKPKQDLKAMTLLLPSAIREKFDALAARKGTNTTNLARVVLTNYVQPGTFEI